MEKKDLYTVIFRSGEKCEFPKFLAIFTLLIKNNSYTHIIIILQTQSIWGRRIYIPSYFTVPSPFFVKVLKNILIHL